MARNEIHSKAPFQTSCETDSRFATLALSLNSNLPNSTGSTPPQQSVQPVQSVAPPATPVQEEEERQLPSFDPYIKKYFTFGRALRAYLEPYHRQIPAFTQGPTLEADKARFERVFRPWPRWVFLLGAESWHAHFPTIRRSIFVKTFRVLNVMIFRCPAGNPSAVRFSTGKASIIERIDIRVLPLVMASFFGHAFEHAEAHRKELEEKLAKDEITQEQFDRSIKRTAREKLERELAERFTDFTKGISPFEFTRAVEEARHKTFDKHGKPKEPKLMPVYRQMLYNWIKIENMSGPKELTHFLLPTLGDKDFFAANARVKTICARLGVKFKGQVKEI